MTNKNDQEFLVQKIRTQYTEKQHTELDELKALDAKVKKPANAFAYTYGSVSAVVMGAGMSLVMTDIGAIVGLASAMVPGIAVGVIGMGMGAEYNMTIRSAKLQLMGDLGMTFNNTFRVRDKHGDDTLEKYRTHPGLYARLGIQLQF